MIGLTSYNNAYNNSLTFNILTTNRMAVCFTNIILKLPSLEGLRVTSCACFNSKI